MQYNIAEFLVDEGRFEVTRDDEPAPLQPQAMKLLLLLVKADGRLVTKAQINAVIWLGRSISETALSSQVKALRKALGDTVRPHRIIGTVHGEGFRILCAITRAASKTKVTSETLPLKKSDASSRRPTIAILPFSRRGDLSGHEAVATALPDDMITALSRLRWVRVIARGSCFRFPSFESSPGEIGQSLKVEYCLSGMIEIKSGQLVILVELADTHDNSVIWTDQLTTLVEALHEVRAETVARIAATLEGRLTQHEIEKMRLNTPAEISPWEEFHLGLSQAFHHDRPDYGQAEIHFRRAIEGDATFARAHAGLAQIQYWKLFQKLVDDERPVAALMCREAKTALDLDPFDPFCHLIRARSHLILHEIDTGMMHLETAKSLAPSFALAYSGLASIQAMSGQPERALENMGIAMRLSPQDPGKCICRRSWSRPIMRWANMTKPWSGHEKFSNHRSGRCRLSPA
ncbi:hypothetical protein C8024_00245 [Sphingopyxis sp. BSNA05]|uniref:winged helix-turn-helix domain-containing protein n=1 Tax=Sphingopyxis sp. BSNA05 TaxID=1236614 RepID=UPI0015661988|nr:winged helix-turn-helix domain-containing protein [Sphingopyxis sp. BSNA05]NRD88217.1 hypothetical protein [Sphingopyxis sp. BSNA05]